MVARWRRTDGRRARRGMLVNGLGASATAVAQPAPLDVSGLPAPIVVVPMREGNRMAQKALRFAPKLSAADRGARPGARRGPGAGAQGHAAGSTAASASSSSNVPWYLDVRDAGRGARDGSGVD
jgi:hypothetical protein